MSILKKVARMNFGLLLIGEGVSLNAMSWAGFFHPVSGRFTLRFRAHRILKVLLFQFILILPFIGIALPENADTTYPVNHPVYLPKNSNVEALKQSVAPLMQMSIKEVIAEVPEETGIFFIGCPNCHSGAEEMNVLGWEPGMGQKVRCNYCGMTFPNKKFPNNREKVIIAPSGARQVYRYYEDSTGHRYYFEAHAGSGLWPKSWLNSGM
jgi:hypothetical protein